MRVRTTLAMDVHPVNLAHLSIYYLLSIIYLSIYLPHPLEATYINEITPPSSVARLAALTHSNLDLPCLFQPTPPAEILSKLQSLFPGSSHFILRSNRTRPQVRGHCTLSLSLLCAHCPTEYNKLDFPTDGVGNSEGAGGLNPCLG